MPSERRHSLRIKPRELLYLKLSSRNGSTNGGVVADLGEGGFRFEFFEPIRLSRFLNASLSLDPMSQFQASGEVIWTDPAKKTGGVRFTALPVAARRQLQAWFDQNHFNALFPEEAASGNSGMAKPAGGIPASASAASVPSVVDSEPRPPFSEERKSILAPTMYVDASATLPFLRDQFNKLKDRSRSAIASEHIRTSAGNAMFRTFESAMDATDAASRFYRTSTSPGVFREAAKIVAGLGVIVVLLVVALSFNGDLGNTLIRLGDKIGGLPSNDGPESAPVEASSPTPPIEATPPASSPSPSTSVPADSSETSPAPVPVRKSTPALKLPDKPVVSAPGEAELKIAQNYLQGVNRAPEPSKAIPWLWTAVRKGNLSADVALADLYMRGVGVPQNCQQGIVLLTAAAKRGDNPALNQLRNLDSGPCGATAKPR